MSYLRPATHNFPDGDTLSFCKTTLHVHLHHHLLMVFHRRYFLSVSLVILLFFMDNLFGNYT